MRYNNMIKSAALLTAAALFTVSLGGCSLFSKSSSDTTTEAVEVDLDNLFSDRDLDASYDASSPKITFTDSSITSDSSNVTISGNTVTISSEGTYILTGTSTDAQVVIDADNDKVQLVLDNLSLTSAEATALYVKQADKVFITLADSSTNSITINSDSEKIDDKNVDGAIFARDDITINGTGTLNVTSTKTNGVVGKDDVKLVSGTININSASHAVDANDSISVKDATINISAGKDGLHCDGSVNIVGGKVDITKSVEGLEGQIINIAGGEINVVSSDDGINAASSDSSSSNDPMAVDESAKLNISGGKLTVDASGDGLDSNGVINISGGETYVSGPTNDGNTAIDFGSECIITGGILIAAGSSGMVEAMSQNSTQPVMTVNASSNSGTITLTGSSGDILASYTPAKTYACVTISAPSLTVGQTYQVTCGDTSQDVSLTETVTSQVQSSMGGPNRGGQGMQRIDGQGNAANRPEQMKPQERQNMRQQGQMGEPPTGRPERPQQ